VTLEVGGKSPNIIFDDADIDKAVVGAFAGIFAATGQTCIAGSRLLVQKPVYNQVVEQLVEKSKTIVLDDPTDHKTEVGTLADEPQFNRVMQPIEAGIADGAHLMAGGGRAKGSHLGKGLFVEPTIFKDVDNASVLAQEEIFGPVLSIIPFDSKEQAIAIGNNTRYGLAGGIWTTNLNRAMRVSKALHAGSIWVNTYRAVAVQAPLGGFKESGFGRERSEWALDEFLAPKNVMIDYSDLARDPFAIKV
jgi:aldehyde dehydrogenase (NAD+)